MCVPELCDAVIAVGIAAKFTNPVDGLSHIRLIIVNDDGIRLPDRVQHLCHMLKSRGGLGIHGEDGPDCRLKQRAVHDRCGPIEFHPCRELTPVFDRGIEHGKRPALLEGVVKLVLRINGVGCFMLVYPFGTAPEFLEMQGKMLTRDRFTRPGQTLDEDEPCLDHASYSFRTSTSSLASRCAMLA